MKIQMTNSPTTSSCNTQDLHLHENNKLPVEIINDEDMAFINAAFSLASPRSSSSTFSLLSSCKSLREFSSSMVCCDVEDLGHIKSPRKKKIKVSHSLLIRFRKNDRGLSVTDFTSTITWFFLFIIIDLSLSLCFMKWVLICSYVIRWFFCWILMNLVWC